MVKYLIEQFNSLPTTLYSYYVFFCQIATPPFFYTCGVCLDNSKNGNCLPDTASGRYPQPLIYFYIHLLISGNIPPPFLCRCVVRSNYSEDWNYFTQHSILEKFFPYLQGSLGRLVGQYHANLLRITLTH